MDIPIIYEDDFLLAIDKPSGIAVNRSENETGETIQDYSEDKIGIRKSESGIEKDNDFSNRAGIVHRLDKDTSGVLLIAKDEASFFALQAQFKARTVEKKYYALVHDKIETSLFKIVAPVSRLPWNRRKFGVVTSGRYAETVVRTKEFFEDKTGNKYTLIEAEPKTGRTHQIRIHLKHVQHPVVCDFLYCGRNVYRQDETIFNRLFLHAYYLKFTHPVKKNPVEIEIPLEADLMNKIITQLTRLK